MRNTFSDIKFAQHMFLTLIVLIITFIVLFLLDRHLGIKVLSISKIYWSIVITLITHWNKILLAVFLFNIFSYILVARLVVSAEGFTATKPDIEVKETFDLNPWHHLFPWFYKVQPTSLTPYLDQLRREGFNITIIQPLASDVIASPAGVYVSDIVYTAAVMLNETYPAVLDSTLPPVAIPDIELKNAALDATASFGMVDTNEQAYLYVNVVKCLKQLPDSSPLHRRLYTHVLASILIINSARACVIQGAAQNKTLDYDEVLGMFLQGELYDETYSRYF